MTDALCRIRELHAEVLDGFEHYSRDDHAMDKLIVTHVPRLLEVAEAAAAFDPYIVDMLRGYTDPAGLRMWHDHLKLREALARLEQEQP